MADVDTDQHGAQFVQGIWELHGEEVSSSLAVDLLQDVGSLRQIELVAVAARDDLGWDAEFTHHFLEHLVVLLAAEHSNAHDGVSEVALLALHHVLHESESELILVLFVFEFDPVRLFDFELELA